MWGEVEDGSRVRSCLWGWGEGEDEGGVGGGGRFASKSSCHPCLEKKKRRKSHTGPLSHFYGNLKAIIVPCHSLWKGFSWRGAGRGGERGGQRAAFSLLTAGKQREEEWMSKRKTPLCGVIQQKSAATHRITLLMWGIFCFDTWLAFSDRSVFWPTAEDQSCTTREKVDLDLKLVCQMLSVGLQLQICSTT